MMHPDVQAQILLSIQEEKRQEAEARRAEGWQEDSQAWHNRLLNASGDALINVGNLLKRHADESDVLSNGPLLPINN
jgi:hypothetical protein